MSKKSQLRAQFTSLDRALKAGPNDVYAQPVALKVTEGDDRVYGLTGG